MGRKVLALRRADACVVCGSALPEGTKAQWDSTARTVTCLGCAEGTAQRPREDASECPDNSPIATDVEGSQVHGGVADPSTGPPAAAEAIDTGTAGLSARKEHERRRAKRDARLEEKWGTGHLGRIAKALSDDPQSTKAWAQGAAGEERVARVLADRLGDRAVLLHDRKVPGTRGNIDHLVIAATGVWIVDAKQYRGKVERRDVGGWFRSDLRLYVGGRDRTKLVDGLQWQQDAVVAALDGGDVPVHSALSFVDAEWPLLFAKPLQLDNVWISWPKKLAELIDKPGPLDASVIESVARLLAERLPANR